MIMQATKPVLESTTWTKELVQSHAQTAVLVEMYTLPFYLTALTSIKLPDKSDTSEQAKFTYETYDAILSVCIEEMLHLQLAANLCLALDIDASKIFQKPIYGESIPYLAPYDPETMGPQMPSHEALLKATLGPLNEVTLKTMLDIETPSEFDTALDHTTPQYPYATIGQMYEALLKGISEVEKNGPVFSWSTENQQEQFMLPPDHKESALIINQKIACFDDAQQAANLICSQGEGVNMTPAPTPPYKKEQFPIKSVYRLYTPIHHSQPGQPKDPETDTLNQYAHYGRFLWIYNQIEQQNKAFPNTYPTSVGTPTPEQEKAINDLKAGFDSFITILTSMWAGGSDSSFFSVMGQLKPLPTKCWQAGIVPQW
ncbi:MAG: ferritin-like domain-containing protein [Cyanobacteria bacterium P01_H01_bin.21]